jgi:hypothetical protein
MLIVNDEVAKTKDYAVSKCRWPESIAREIM